MSSTLPKQKYASLTALITNLTTPLLVTGPTGSGKSYHIKRILLEQRLKYVNYVVKERMRVDGQNVGDLYGTGSSYNPINSAGNSCKFTNAQNAPRPSLHHKNTVLLIDTDNFADILTLPTKNVIVESRAIYKLPGYNCFKFGPVSVSKFKRLLNACGKESVLVENQNNIVSRDRVSNNQWNISIKDDELASLIKNDKLASLIKNDELTVPIKNDKLFTSIKNDESAISVQNDELSIPYKNNGILPTATPPETTTTHINMHMFPYIHIPNIHTHFHLTINIFHYLGKIFHSKKKYDYNSGADKIVNYLFENYLYFYEYEELFGEEISANMHNRRNSGELVVLKAYKISNKRKGKFVSFKAPVYSPFNYHRKNEYEDLS